jgi:hypothetical protein
MDGLGKDVKLHICKWSALDPDPPGLFLNQKIQIPGF